MSTDFIDDDLIRTARGASLLRPRQAPDGPDVVLEKHRMREHQEALTQQLTGSARQLEELRLKRMELERARADLETLGQKQEDYAVRKRGILSRLDAGLEAMDRREQEAARLIELIEAVRRRFQEARGDLGGVDEGAWGGEAYEAQLSQALRQVEDAETVVEAGQSKLQAGDWLDAAGGQGGRERKAAGGLGMGGVRLPGAGFGGWFLAGLAFSLALALAGLLAYGFWLVLAVWRG